MGSKLFKYLALLVRVTVEPWRFWTKKPKICVLLVKSNLFYLLASLHQTLQSELQNGHSILKSLRERAEQTAGFLTESGAQNLGCEVETRLAQLEELACRLRQKHSFLQRMLLLGKEFQDRYKAQAQWLVETKALLSTPVEAKAELYQRRALLAKHKVD